MSEDTPRLPFAQLWKKSEATTKELNERHSYNLGEHGKENTSPEFKRFDEFIALEPVRAPVFEGPLPEFLGYDSEGNVLSENAMPELTHTRTSTEKRTFCGASRSPRQVSDEWEEWNRVKNAILLGGERRARTGRGYTVFPGDASVNAAILGCANKFIPARIVDGLPCEEFRDLCSHLAMYGLDTFADGTVSTYHLTTATTEYMRKTAAPQTLSVGAAKGRFFTTNNPNDRNTP